MATTRIRVYIPTSVAGLAGLRDTGALAAVHVYAVTAQVVTSYPGLDDEEHEYVAMCEAVDAASALRADPRARRVVVAADVAAVTEPTGPGPVVLDEPLSRVAVVGPVELADIVSLHLDEAGADEDEELLWYDISELEQVIDELAD